MKTIMRTFTIMLLGISISALAFAQKTLPSVKVKDLKGNEVDIAKYAKNGKITVINFWATWCSPCKKELTNISEMYEDWTSAYDMELIAVSIDDSRNVPKVKTYVAGTGWEYEVLIDANQDLKRALNFQTIPFTILLDKDGNIVYKHTGYVAGDEYELEDKIKALSK